MHEVVKEAVERARKGEGPTFIEARTFRHRGHFEGTQWIMFQRCAGRLEKEP